jgi:hypothetical protein
MARSSDDFPGDRRCCCTGQINTGVFPYARGAFAPEIVGHWLAPLDTGVNTSLRRRSSWPSAAFSASGCSSPAQHLHIFLAR